MKLGIIVIVLFVSLDMLGQDSLVSTPHREIIMSASKLKNGPEFPGGMNAFYGFIKNNFNLSTVKSEIITARVYLRFIVEADGTMSNYEILKDSASIGTEMIKVLKLIKEKWSPGMIEGQPVRASYNLPITINIK
jgi:protein TonB